jgi:hypothetical protein
MLSGGKSRDGGARLPIEDGLNEMRTDSKIRLGVRALSPDWAKIDGKLASGQNRKIFDVIRSPETVSQLLNMSVLQLFKDH